MNFRESALVRPLVIFDQPSAYWSLVTNGAMSSKSTTCVKVSFAG